LWIIKTTPSTRESGRQRKFMAFFCIISFNLQFQKGSRFMNFGSFRLPVLVSLFFRHFCAQLEVVVAWDQVDGYIAVWRNLSISLKLEEIAGNRSGPLFTVNSRVLVSLVFLDYFIGLQEGHRCETLVQVLIFP
jgi:hypothetical protein